MKNLILIFIFANCFNIQAQTNGKFFADTCYWHIYDWYHMGPFAYGYQNTYQKVQGDTLHNGKIFTGMETVLQILRQ